ncbi:MAG: hypothetical protein R3B70_07720 [Polyangiaceae bacterium]
MADLVLRLVQPLDDLLLRVGAVGGVEREAVREVLDRLLVAAELQLGEAKVARDVVAPAQLEGVVVELDREREVAPVVGLVALVVERVRRLGLGGASRGPQEAEGAADVEGAGAGGGLSPASAESAERTGGEREERDAGRGEGAS